MADDTDLLPRFLAHFRIDPDAPPEDLLRQVTAAFTRVPYENLTKIIRDAEAGSVEKARRDAGEVIADHVSFGAGGTCFSLTATLLHLLHSLGWQAKPILADRPYGPDTHCALLVWIAGRPHLLDPGYLITDPIPLEVPGERIIPTTFHDLRLVPGSSDTLDLYTVNRGQSTLRITFKTAPVDWGEFVKVWHASFDWNMMHFPVLTRVTGNQHVYLQGNRLQRRTRDCVQRTELPPDDLADEIARTFGIEPSLVARALAILQRQGDLRGRAAVS
jgi:arylamine N-acetyltransferase